MTKSAYDKIAAGLREALEVAQGRKACRLWRLNADGSRIFVDALVSPPKPNEALRQAADRYRASNPD